MSLNLKILSWILTLYMFRLVSAASNFPKLASYQHFVADQKPRHKPSPALSNPLIGDDGRMYMCHEKKLLVFLNNGSISRSIPLNFTCNIGITPVLGASKRVYLVAENRVLKINTMYNTGNPKSSGEVFVGPETGVENMNEVIGLAVSLSSSCVLITLNKRGLFAYKYDGRMKWSVGPATVHMEFHREPVLHEKGYSQGCSKNITGCYFVSVPVIDYCDANVYMMNNRGELYSISIRTPHFKWIQDLSPLGKNFTITAGNNGQLYVTVPEKSVILALDVLTGNTLWQQNIGPLSAVDSAPVADANGWISIGSLDGFLYSISPSGVISKFPRREINDTVIQVNPVLDCSGYAVYISQTKMEGKINRIVGDYTYITASKALNTTATLVNPASGSVYWSESHPGLLSSLFNGTDLRSFVIDGRVLLAFLSISNTGNSLSCSSTRQKLASSCSKMDIKKVSIYTGNEEAIERFLLIETIILIFVSILVRFCCVFWKKKKLQNQNLGNFLEKRSSLQVQKKVFDRTITELEKKVAEGSSTNEMVEKLGYLVKERENVERKLLTTYSLGRDATYPQSKSLIPLSDKKTKSFSSKSGQKESVTIFHTISDTSSDDGDINQEVDMMELKGKTVMVTECSSDDDVAIVEEQEQEVMQIVDEGNDDGLQIGGTSMRKRSISVTHDVGSSL